MARPVRKTVKEVPLAEVKDDFSRYLKEAAAREILITRHGKPADILIGFESEDDWLEAQGHGRNELSSGEIVWAELHCYEATGIGRREFKIKRLL